MRNPCPPLISYIIGLLVLGATSACWVPTETGQAMQRDIKNLRTDVEDTRKGIDEARAQLIEQVQKADASVVEVDKKLQELNRAARQTDAGFGVRLDELQRELGELRGQNELLTYKLSQMEQRLAALDELQQRLDALETHAPSTPSTSAAPASSAPPADIPEDKKGMLAYANQLLKDKKLEDARGVLRRVVERWPSDPGVTDQAYYLIGETYFREKKYRPALLEYIKVVENFPKGDMVDDAYYRVGLCSIELGNLEDALIFFDEIINKHRKSPLVKAAKKQHREVSKRLEAEKKGKGR